ncbi:uncharacterized protein N7459_000752 [Penicillium hispanicum]|uniref:uncharacterized protein n=1 Tax=Penicillium hispanicum TaxID=1080232 RepID=UPI002540B80F|nr:uncharacterized protein N7459_000752 [Penicillium hispanicum]KAJ5594544.1 hypothetical protein N7459_000752 [Penicillium hispanicum]
MPSLKRVQESLGSDEDEDQSDSGSERTTSISPHHSRKRPRTSSSPISEEDEGLSDLGIDAFSPTADDALLDDDELELRQTQLIQRKYAHLADEANIPAEHGILERVDCYNFMCHDHFSVELGPLINFIVGKNGSGKSAILTAITLCLGGKASATNRGQSLKSFIKEGKDNATIVVRIKNQGDGAYMVEDYGKSIIVERHFSKTGASGFKLKAENGRIVSTKKSELDSITDYFSLQIDNPMNVLSQDMARQFLSTSSPADKYKFFVKGVQLEQLDQDYRLIEESVDQIEEKLRSKVQDIRILETRKDAAKKKLEISDQHDSLRERVRNLRSQMAWAQVEEQERERDSLANEVANADQAIGRAEAALGEFDVSLQAMEAEAETAAEHAWQADSALEEARGKKDKIKEKQDEGLHKRHDLLAEQRQIRDYLKAAEERVSETQNKIDAENRRLAEVSGGGYARKQEECEQAATRAATARKTFEEHGQGVGHLREDIQASERADELVKQQVDAKKDDVKQAEFRLQALAREDGHRQSGFPDKMPSLLRAIRQEQSFTTRPIGPIGDHVTLLKPKWSSILESSFGNTLSSFVVSSKRDMGILSSIMRRVGCNCQIFIGKGNDIDTSAHEPDSHYDTALRILQIDNPMVRRQLIINHSIEQMLLIENLQEATSVLFDGPRPKNVKRCYCIDAKDRRRGIHLTYARSGDPIQGPVAMYTGHPRMKSDVASQIRQALVQHQQTDKALKVEMQKMEDYAESLRDALDKENAGGGQIDALKAALQEADDERQLTQGSLEDSVTAMNAMMQTLREIRREMSKQDNEISILQEKARIAESERSVVENKKRDVIRDKNAALERIQNDKQVREKIKEKQEQIAARVAEYKEKASMVSARVPVDEGETPNSLDQKLDRLHRDLERYNQQLGASRDEIAAEAGRTEAAYLRAMKQVDELSTLAQVSAATVRRYEIRVNHSQIFKDTLDNRKKRWEIFRSHISSRAKAQFTYLLSERSFRGRLLADHNNKLLDLQVEPDITKDDSTGRGAKTLSGGEKSFSQVCLLLALWEAMGSPIRCLDEFDVYMDHINRRMAIDMLMTAARRSIGRQFILITPGTKTDITIAPDVRVKELAEPERGQTTLSFRR